MGKAANVDEYLDFMRQVFGMRMLHLGLFTDGVPHDVNGVYQAQYEYTRALIGLIPEGVSSVLDVGCGTGETSKMLKESGFEPEGLSPDPVHGEKFVQTMGPEGTFHLTGFEDFRPHRTYDCLLFSESPQYIDKDSFFPKCCELTRPGSCLVVADFFRFEPDPYYPNSFFERDFRGRAERAGFKIAYHRDVTEEVLPNLDVSMELLRYGQRMLRYGQDSLSNLAPTAWKIVKRLYRRKLATVHTLLFDKLPMRLDSKRFRQNMRYAFYRLER